MQHMVVLNSLGHSLLLFAVQAFAFYETSNANLVSHLLVFRVHYQSVLYQQNLQPRQENCQVVYTHQELMVYCHLVSTSMRLGKKSELCLQKLSAYPFSQKQKQTIFLTFTQSLRGSSLKLLRVSRYFFIIHSALSCLEHDDTQDLSFRLSIPRQSLCSVSYFKGNQMWDTVCVTWSVLCFHLRVPLQFLLCLSSTL